MPRGVLLDDLFPSLCDNPDGTAWATGDEPGPTPAWDPGGKPSLGSIMNPLLIRRAVTNDTSCFTPFKVLYGIRYSTDNNELITGSWIFLLSHCTENLAKSSICWAATWETHSPRLVNRHKKGYSSVEDQDSVLSLDSIDISTTSQTDGLEDLSFSIGF